MYQNYIFTYLIKNNSEMITYIKLKIIRLVQITCAFRIAGRSSFLHLIFPMLIKVVIWSLYIDLYSKEKLGLNLRHFLLL